MDINESGVHNRGLEEFSPDGRTGKGEGGVGGGRRLIWLGLVISSVVLLWRIS